MSDEKKPNAPGDLVPTPKNEGDAPAAGPTPEELAHAKRMKELFGDLGDDEDDPETIEDVRADRNSYLEQVERLKASVQRTRKENSSLMQQINQGKEKIAAVEELRAQDKKELTKQFLTDLLPVADQLAAGLAEIDAAERAANPKLDKLTAGVESTLNQLTAVFNKNGIKKGDTAAPAAPAANTSSTPEDVTPPAASTPDATPETPAAPKETKNETIEELKAQRDALMAEASALSSTVGRAQTDNLTLTRRIEEGKNLLAREEAKREEEKVYGVEKPLKELMPVIDTLELGLKQINPKARAEDKNFDFLAKTVESSLANITAVFNKYNIEQINPIDQPFDAERHEAITVAPVPGKEPETVVQVVLKGYALKDRNVRHAKVVVTPPEF